MHVDDLLLSAGGLRAAYEERDWAATPLGPMSEWSPTLRNAVDLTLNTNFPVTLMWGPEHVLVYNESYVELIGDKHPHALGRPSEEIFPEIWDQIGPLMRAAFFEGRSTWLQDAYVPLVRRGFLEDCFFTFCYSAVRNEHGEIEGAIDLTVEVTRQVVGRRRLALLSGLGIALNDAADPRAVATTAAAILADDVDDLPDVEIRIDGVRSPRADVPLPESPLAPIDDREIRLEERDGGQVAWIALGRAGADGERPHLVARLSPRLPVDDEYLSFLGLVGAALRQALDRVARRAAERRLASTQRGMAEAFQRSLLPDPRDPEGLRIAVHYQPAAAEAQVGGDWYDAFPLPDGSLALAVGDVSGHDRAAAAAMAQVRNLMRGVASTLGGPPSRILGTLDRVLDTLAPDLSATVVLAQATRGDDGTWDLVWSNAGHLPPVLLADGAARLLETPADPILGLAVEDRADHRVTLAPGASIVLYTDGLIERRGVPLAVSLATLVDGLRGARHLPADAIVDQLVNGLTADEVEDDVALMVLRALPAV